MDPITVQHVRDEEKKVREFASEIPEDFHIIHIPLCRGRARITSDGRVLHEGAIFPRMMRLSSPGEKVSAIVYTPSEAALLQIPGPFLGSTVLSISASHMPGEVCFVDALLQPSCGVERLGRLLLCAEDFDPKHVRLFLEGMASSLLAYLLQHQGVRSRAARQQDELEPELLQRCVDFADANMGNGLDLNTWAAAVGIPAAEFSRRFRLSTGTSPYAWFMQWRIDRSKDRLCHPKRSLSDVALSVGFSSQSHFSEAFRRHVGTSPARWGRARLSSGIR